MDLTTSIATKNPCYKAGKSIKVQGIILEGVGCPQASAKVFAHNRNREDCEGRCAHAFVDANDGSVIQILPWGHRGWHCGKHPRTKLNANNTHIGIQLCEPSQIRYRKKNLIELAGDKEKAMDAVRKTYESAVELCAFLCEKFHLDPMTAVISRKEGYDAAICSMNASPEFVWKLVGADFTMDKLREDVKNAMVNKLTAKTYEEMGQKVIEGLENGFNQPDEQITEMVGEAVSIVEPVLNTVEFRGFQVDVPIDSTHAITSEPVLEEKEEKSVESVVEEPKLQMVRITVDNLRVRSSPGIGNNTTGKFTGVGVFAITEIQNGSGSKLGWGKLQNGAGWICLDYVEML